MCAIIFSIVHISTFTTIRRQGMKNITFSLRIEKRFLDLLKRQALIEEKYVSDLITDTLKEKYGERQLTIKDVKNE